MEPVIKLKLHNTLLYLCDYLLRVLPVEWRIATKQNVQNHPYAPYVTSLIVGLGEYFRSYIVWCSYNRVQELTLHVLLA